MHSEHVYKDCLRIIIVCRGKPEAYMERMDAQSAIRLISAAYIISKPCATAVCGNNNCKKLLHGES